MGPQPDEPMSDPLLRPDTGPRDHRGTPVRAPLGNSIKTLLVFAVLLAIVVLFLWWRSPTDLASELGGREWVITDVDGEPARNERGTVSTFVLDGNGEVRGVLDCNVATGSWRYEPGTDRLRLDWTTQTVIACADDWPTTYLPTSGDLDVGGGELVVSDPAATVAAISLVELEPALPEEIAGIWVTGGDEVNLGRRGLVELGTCRGDWTANDDGTITIEFDELQRDDCSLDPAWRSDVPFVAVLHEGALYLRRDRSIFPLDRDIIRLDPADS